MAASANTTAITLNWTAAGGANSVNQDVQRRVFGSTTWATIQTVGPTTNTYVDASALVDTSYEYQIVNNCSVGGPTSGGTAGDTFITCVTFIANAQGLSIIGEYGELFNDTAWSKLQLFDSTGNTVIQSAPATGVPTGQTAGGYQFTDAGVDYETDYIVRASLIAPDGTTKDGDVSGSTGVAPSCDAPTGLTATVAAS